MSAIENGVGKRIGWHAHEHGANNVSVEHKQDLGQAPLERPHARDLVVERRHQLVHEEARRRIWPPASSVSWTAEERAPWRTEYVVSDEGILHILLRRYGRVVVWAVRERRSRHVAWSWSV